MSTLSSCTKQPSPEPLAPTTDQALLQQRREAGIADCPQAPARPGVEGGLPDLTLDCLGSGSQVNLSGLTRDRPMLVNYWAQWCGPCRREAPHLAAVHRSLGAKVDFIGVDASDPRPELAIAFAQEAQWPWPQVSDPEFRSRELLPIAGLPHTVLVAGDGRVVHHHVGPINSAAELAGLIQQHLGVTP